MLKIIVTHFCRALALVAAALAPPLVSELFLRKLLYSSLGQYIPGPPDPMMYWHETGSFFRAGLQHGYYGMDEMIPLLGSSWHHGPWFVGFYAMLAKLGGEWTFTTAVTLNFILLALACVLYAWLVRAGLGLCLLLAAFVSTFHYLLLYACSNWSEAFVFCVALVLAGLWARLLEAGQLDQACRETRSYRLFKALAFAVLVYASLLRHSFALLFFIYFFLDRPKNLRQALSGAAKALAALVACLALYETTKAPFVTKFSGGERLLHALMRGDLSLLWVNLADNWAGLAAQYQLYSLFLLQALFLCLGSLILTWLDARQTQTADPQKLYAARMVSAFHLVNLFGVTALLVVYYVVHGPWGYRVLAPHFVLSLFVLAAGRHRLLPWALTAVNVAALPFMLHLFTVDRMAEYFDTAPLKYQIQDAAQSLKSRFDYTPKTDRWCNTVLYSGGGRLLLSIPLGVGIQFHMNNRPLDSIRSRFLAGGTFSPDMFTGPVALEVIPAPSGPQLYINQHSACPQAEGAK